MNSIKPQLNNPVLPHFFHFSVMAHIFVAKYRNYFIGFFIGISLHSIYLVYRIIQIIFDTSANLVIGQIISDFDNTWDYVAEYYQDVLGALPLQHIILLISEIIACIAIFIIYKKLKHTKVDLINNFNHKNI